MALAYLDTNIEIPNVKTQETEYINLSDGEYTAGGNYRKDSLGILRVWTLESEYLLSSQYNAITTHLVDNNFTETVFWLDEFGGSPATDSIDVFAIITDDEREHFGKDGVWHSDGRKIALEIIEI